MTQLWDPLWEYVLEDYDHVDESKAKRRNRSSRNSNSSGRSAKSNKSSSTRNMYPEKKKRNQQDQKEEEQDTSNLLNMSMNSWNFFDMSGDDNQNGGGDHRDDESDQLGWNDEWYNDRDVKEEQTKSPVQRKGILRRSDSKSSTGSRKNSSSRSLSKQTSGRLGLSRNKSVGSSQDMNEYGSSADIKTKRSTSSAGSKNKELRSSLKKSPSAGSNKRLSSQQSKSETSFSSQGQVQNIQNGQVGGGEDESAGFAEMWDVLTGKPPVGVAQSQKSVSTATVPESSDGEEPPITKSPSGRNRIFSLSLRKSNSESSAQQREKEAKIKSVVKGAGYRKTKEQKRSRMFRRRSKKDQQVESKQREFSLQEPTEQIQEIGLNDTKEESNDRDNNSSQPMASAFADFDPLMMLFEVAGRLDPWAVDSSVDDSRSETTASETTGANEESSDVSHSEVANRTRGGGEAMESLLDQPLPDPNDFDARYAYHPQQARSPKTSYSTEIRLKVNTVGDTVSEEVYKRTPAVPDEDSEPDTENSQLWGTTQAATPSSIENGLGARISVVDSSTHHSSFDNSSKPAEKPVDLEKLSPMLARAQLDDPASTEVEQQGQNEFPVPMDLHIQTENDNGAEVFEDLDDDGFPSSQQRGIWKAVCCSVGKKTNKGDLINRLRKEDVAAVFPTTRVIANGQSRSITGHQADHVNGVMGVPSDHFVDTKGPQSLYAYDYENNEHMDVCYTEVNKKPRSSIKVRELGTPPSLSKSSAQDIVVVQIEASTISETDCLIRQGKWWHENDEPPLPNTPGVDFVGKIFRIKETTELEYHLRPRQSVLSLTRWGGNSRYCAIHPKKLVKVPDGLDPAEVATLPETYLTAFQCLHMGQSGSRRYRDNSLKGKSVLIIGCMSNNIGKAIIELALNAGVANIYATSKKKHWKTLISYGVLPLSPEPMEWIHRIEGTIDLVLAPNGNIREDVTPVHFRALLPKQGQLILCGHRSVGHDIPINDWKKDQFTFSCGRNKALTNILNKSYAYDVYEAWDTKLDVCKKDLDHLLQLLEQGALKPEVLDRLPLNKVAKAQDLLESKRLPGFLVCEPWMRGKKRAVYL